MGTTEIKVFLLTLLLFLLTLLLCMSSLASAANPANSAAGVSFRSPAGYTDGTGIPAGTLMAYTLHYSQAQGFACGGSENRIVVLNNTFTAPDTFLKSTADLSQLSAGTWYFRFSVNNSGCSNELARTITDAAPAPAPAPAPELIFDKPTRAWVEVK